jgi:hypothetical protein
MESTAIQENNSTNGQDQKNFDTNTPKTVKGIMSQKKETDYKIKTFLNNSNIEPGEKPSSSKAISVN